MDMKKILLIVVCVACVAEAGAKTLRKRPPLKLLEAYSVNATERVPQEPVRLEYHFIIVWDRATYPESFFWRGENGWMNCNINRGHKMLGGKASTINYTTEPLTGDIHKGDTLELMPVRGGKFPVPKEIPATAKNTLYYKTGGSGWMSYKVQKIVKKHDVVVR